MSKLKTFEQYVAEKTTDTNQEVVESTARMDAVDVSEKFHRMSKDVIEEELYAASQALKTYYDWLEAGNDSGQGKTLDHIINLLKKCKADIKKFNKKEEVEGTVYEATVIMDAVDPKAKSLKKLLKKYNVTMKVINKSGPGGGWPEIEMEGSREDLTAVLADPTGWDDADLAEYIEESNDTFTVKVKALNEEEVEEVTESIKCSNKKGHSYKEIDKDGTVECEHCGLKNSLSEKVEETKDSKEVAEMLKEVYESCKSEAKVWEEDAHDDHTAESYMKENAALVATLSSASLKEMKEDYTTEAFEAACNEMIESYTKKMNEMKETESAEDAGAVE